MGYCVIRTRDEVEIMGKVLDFWGPPSCRAPGWHLLCDATTLRNKGIHVVGDVPLCARLVVRLQALEKVQDSNDWRRAQDILLHVLRSELGGGRALELSFTGGVNELASA